MYQQRLGVVTDTEYLTLTPSVEPPPDGNGVPPPPPPPVNWVLYAVLGLVGLAIVSGGK